MANWTQEMFDAAKLLKIFCEKLEKEHRWRATYIRAEYSDETLSLTWNTEGLGGDGIEYAENIKVSWVDGLVLCGKETYNVEVEVKKQPIRKTLEILYEAMYLICLVVPSLKGQEALWLDKYKKQINYIDSKS